MLRPVIASTLAAVSIAAGLHTSVAAAPPVFLECRTSLEALPVVSIVIAEIDEGNIRDAVRHCRVFWGGHPTGTSR